MSVCQRVGRFLSSFAIHGHSLRAKIVVSQAAFAMVPFLLLAVPLMITLNENKLRGKEEALSNNLNICTQSIQQMYNAYLSESINLPYNDYIYSDLDGALNNDMPKIVELQIVMPSMTSAVNNSRNLSSSVLFYLENYRYSPTLYCAPLGSFPEKNKKAAVLSASFGDVTWSNTIFSDTTGFRYICFYRNLSSMFGKHVVIQMNIPFDNIRSYMDNIELDDDGTVMLLRDRSGRIRYLRSGSGSLPANRFSPRKYMTVSTRVLKDGSTLSIGLSTGRIWESRFIVVGEAFLFCAVFAMLVLLMSNVATKRMTNGLTQFVDYLRANERDLLNGSGLHTRIRERDEIDTIQNKFVQLLTRMNGAYHELVRIQTQKSLLELNLLQANVNPHLLYNSFSAIRMCAVRNKDTFTMQIVDALARYYRSALSNGENVIPVANEVQFIQDYLEIMQLTYQQSYRLVVDIPAELQNQRILRHLLQPIVENAVKHAFGTMEDGKTISITGQRREDAIRFVIEDNGCGMEPELARKLVSLEYKADRGGYGIRNVIQRIRLFYGNASGLAIRSEPGKGTAVTVTIFQRG